MFWHFIQESATFFYKQSFHDIMSYTYRKVLLCKDIGPFMQELNTCIVKEFL